MVLRAQAEPVEFVLVDEVEPNKFGSYLFLEPHELFPRQWQVSAEHPAWRTKFRGLLGPVDSISIFALPGLFRRAVDEGYGLAFFDDPQPIFEWLVSLDSPPQVNIYSEFEGTVGGFLPFQVQAHNFALSCERTVFFEHSTGSGKTVSAEGMILAKKLPGAFADGNGFDLCLYVVKPNYLEDAFLSLGRHTDLASEALVIKGGPERRRKLYGAGYPILIMNAEKFREDTDEVIELVTDKNLLVVVDEIPTKYSNRGSALYRSTARALYDSYAVAKRGQFAGKQLYYPKAGKERARQMFGVQMSAYPIITSPEGFFNSMRLFDSTVFGSVANFHKTYVRGWDPWGNPSGWKNLDLLSAMAAHVVHHVDKRSPEIAAQFPEFLPPEEIQCPLDANTAKLYTILQSEYQKVYSDLSILSYQELLAAVQVLQLLCCNPRAVLKSALEFERFVQGGEELEAAGATDAELLEYWHRFKHGSKVAWKFRQKVNNDALFVDRDKQGNCTLTKMIKMREKLEAHGDKSIIFTGFNDLSIPYLSEWLYMWGIPHVTYHGELSKKVGQENLDRFRYDSDIWVLLSSDAGQDSINLPQASLTNHYDPPNDISYAGYEQRNNRMHRIDSQKKSVRSIVYTTPGTVEPHKWGIVDVKRGHHEAVFSGGQIGEPAKTGRSELMRMIIGDNNGI